MVAKRPEDRQQSMAEAVTDLETCMGRRGAATQSLGEMSDSYDRSMLENLSFLQEAAPVHRTTAALKKKADPAVEATFAYQSGMESSRQLDLPKKLLTVVRAKKAVTAAVGLAVVALIVALAITIRIRHPDGKQSSVTVPNGSKVTVGNRGDVDVALPKGAPVSDDSAPTFKGGFDPKLAAETGSPRPLAGEGQGVRAMSPFLGADGNWRLPPNAPPPAIAPFDARRAKQHQEGWAKHLGVPVEQTNSMAQGAVGPDERQVFGAADRAVARAVGVGDQAVVQQVHQPADAALLQLFERVT